MKNIESPEVKVKKENVSERQKEILDAAGFDNIAAAESWLEMLEPNSDAAEALRLLLSALKGAEPIPKKKDTISRIEELYEGISSEGISDKGPGSEKEAEEYFEAVGREVKREEETKKAEEEEPLNKKENPWAFEEEKKSAIKKIWEEIKKLIK